MVRSSGSAARELPLFLNPAKQYQERRGILNYEVDNPYGELSLENPGRQVTGMGDSGGELFSKSCCYFYVAAEGFGRKGDGMIGIGFGTFPILGFDYAPYA